GWGTRSDMSIPDRPYLPQRRWLPRQSGSSSRNWLWIFPKLGGRGWPSSRLSSGLGSNRSTWLGPPVMNRKMHRLALAGKWPALGARAPAGGGEPAAGRASRASRAARPSRPDPHPARLSSSRRLRGRIGCGPGQRWCDEGSDILVFLGLTMPVHLREQRGQLQGESRQDVAALQPLGVLQHGDRAVGRVHRDPAP